MGWFGVRVGEKPRLEDSALKFSGSGLAIKWSGKRFLVSFGGQYLAHNICVSSMGCKKEGDTNSVDHQLLKIYVPPTDLYLFGPAFIEVENLSGLSNFIPILIGDKEVCVEMELLQKKFNTSHGFKEQQLSSPRSACEILVSRQAEFSRFLLEVAWSLKKPVSEQQLTSTRVQRFNYLLNFLIERESAVILERMLHCMKSKMDNNFVVGISDADMKLIWANMDNARNILRQKLEEKEYSVMHVWDGKNFSQISQHDSRSSVPSTNRGLERAKNKLESRVVLPSLGQSATVPHLNGELLMSVNLEERTSESCSRLFTMTVVISHPLAFAIATVGVCFGICAIILHPRKVGVLATTIPRCLFDNS